MAEYIKKVCVDKPVFISKSHVLIDLPLYHIECPSDKCTFSPVSELYGLKNLLHLDHLFLTCDVGFVITMNVVEKHPLHRTHLTSTDTIKNIKETIISIAHV